MGGNVPPFPPQIFGPKIEVWEGTFPTTIPNLGLDPWRGLAKQCFAANLAHLMDRVS